MEFERFNSVPHTKQQMTIFVVERASERLASVRFALICRSESSRRNWSSCFSTLKRVSASFDLTIVIGVCCQQLFVSNHSVIILKCLAVY